MRCSRYFLSPPNISLASQTKTSSWYFRAQFCIVLHCIKNARSIHRAKPQRGTVQWLKAKVLQQKSTTSQSRRLHIPYLYLCPLFCALLTIQEVKFLLAYSTIWHWSYCTKVWTASQISPHSSRESIFSISIADCNCFWVEPCRSWDQSSHASE